MKLSQWTLFFSGVISALLISTAYQSPIVAQGDSASSFKQTISSSTLAQLPILPASSGSVSSGSVLSGIDASESDASDVMTQANPARVPSAVMAPAEGSVSVQIINQTAESLTYQALGDTAPRVLTADSTVTLQRLPVPATVTFAYQTIQKNRSAGIGLLQVDLRTSQGGSHLDLFVQPTDSLDADASNLTVESSGNVFIF